MTPIEKAKELVYAFKPYSYYDAHDLTTRVKIEESNIDSAIECAIICVSKIIDALISGGRDSFELQNMDKEFRFWYEVKDKLNRMKS